MKVEGRDEPFVQVDITNDGCLNLRVDFGLYLPGWATIRITKEEIKKVLEGLKPEVE